MQFFKQVIGCGLTPENGPGREATPGDAGGAYLGSPEADCKDDQRTGFFPTMSRPTIVFERGAQLRI